MKSSTERDLHLEALVWKTKLQETEDSLYTLQKKLYTAKLQFDAMDTDEDLERLNSSADLYSDKLKRLKQRLSSFENRISFHVECDTSQCDTAFFEEADTISILLKNISKNVKVLASETSYFTDSKITD